jgi:RNA polymerase sigma factor (sigma-70 family)
MAYSKQNISKQSPEVLWQNFCAGDMSSFRLLYNNYYQPLYNYGLKYLAKNEVEDCIQDLFLYILQHRKTIAKVRNVNGYLFRSYRNQLSKKANAKRIIFEKLENNMAKETENLHQEGFVTEFLQSLIAKLSPREQEIVQLRYFKSLKNKEIAASLNIDYQTVRNTLSNAIQKMRVQHLQIEI